MVKKTEAEGLIFKIKRFAIHDGPGIRTAIFLKGCPLSCIWCHSPEGISSDVTVWYNWSTCILCGKCISVCPEKALSFSDDEINTVKIRRDICNLSGKCVEECPTDSIQFTGRRIKADEIVSEVEKDILYFRESGGGVTLTGGEPLAQPEFSLAVLGRCLEKGIDTAIETSLFCKRDVLARFEKVTRLFITDLKIFDPVNHTKYTGVSNETIIDNFRYLAGRGNKIIVRVPLIPSLTDTQDNLDAISYFVKSIDSSIPVELIKYNPLAENNYRKLNLRYLVNSK